MSELDQYPLNDTPCLYGLRNSNRTGDELWGKNQFNSTFPTALACLMRDRGVKPVYLSVDSKLKVIASEITFDEVFNTAAANNELRFDFESKYLPYQQYSLDDIGGIDLVVKRNGTTASDPATWCRPLEVKLTVIPDNTTYNRPESEWGSELVIRPASTKYCALGIRHAIPENRLESMRNIFEPVCGAIRHWESKAEITANREPLVQACNVFQSQFYELQKPFLMQPVWKTIGRSARLHENAFDIFIWSDFALCRAFLDKSIVPRERKVNRFMRSTARFARVLYELSRSGRVPLRDYYTHMNYDIQTDKEFALSGRISRKYMNCSRLTTPLLRREIVLDLILNGGEKYLSPERRFDATVYFTAAQLFDDRRG